MHELHVVLVKATKAWADYQAYTDDFRILQDRKRLETYFHNNRCYSALNLSLQNVATAFKIAVRRWSEFDAFSHELCAIFPNVEIDFYFELHKDVAKWVHEQSDLKIRESAERNLDLKKELAEYEWQLFRLALTEVVFCA